MQVGVIRVQESRNHLVYPYDAVPKLFDVTGGLSSRDFPRPWQM